LLFRKRVFEHSLLCKGVEVSTPSGMMGEGFCSLSAECGLVARFPDNKERFSGVLCGA